MNPSRVKIAALGLLVGSTAFAQTGRPGDSVSLYGLIDVGVDVVSNVGASGRTVERMPLNSNTAPSRIGVRGSESLGSGLRTVFTFEGGFAPGTGTLQQGGRAWGRQAFVGIAGPFGTISLGRQYTMTFWAGTSADVHGGGVYGTGSLDSYLPNARADNAIAWRGTFGQWTLGADYSFGRDSVNAGPSPAGTNCPQVSGDSQACRQWSAMVKYDSQTWGAALSYDRLNGRNVGPVPDAVFGGLNSRDKSDSRLYLNGWFKIKDIKLAGGIIRRDNDGNSARPRSNLIHIGVIAPITPTFTLSAQALTLRYHGVDQYNSTLVAVRGTYAFSKRTAAFVQVARINNQAHAALSVSGGGPGTTPAAGGDQTGFNIGLRHSF